MLWDLGEYDGADGADERALQRGHAEGRVDFVLRGTRLRGGWTLVRMRRPGKPQWLLMKRDDAFAARDVDVVAEQLTSVATGRTMEEIAAE